MHDCRGIDRLSTTQRRFKTHFVRRCNGGFIQPMAKSTNHAIHMQLPGGAEHDFEKYFTLQPQLAGFVGINRIRFVSDLYRVRSWTRFQLPRLLGTAGRCCLRCKPARMS